MLVLHYYYLGIILLYQLEFVVTDQIIAEIIGVFPY